MAGSRRPFRRICLSVAIVCLVASWFLLRPAFAAWTPAALAPLEILAGGFHDLRGLALGPDGALYVTDRHGGVVYRVMPAAGGAAQVTTAQAGLQDPAGLAWGPEDILLVVEEKRGQVIRLDGTSAPVWTGLDRPTWVAVAPDGTLYATARGLSGKGGGGQVEPQRDPAGGGRPG